MNFENEIKQNELNGRTESDVCCVLSRVDEGVGSKDKLEIREK